MLFTMVEWVNINTLIALAVNKKVITVNRAILGALYSLVYKAGHHDLRQRHRIHPLRPTWGIPLGLCLLRTSKSLM